MACCGNKRMQINSIHQVYTPGEQTDPVYFQYVGRTGLTVIGRETRSRYRFDSPGAIVAIDARDKHAMTYVPNLRQVIGRKTA